MRKLKNLHPLLLASVLSSLFVPTPTARAQGTALTYQGRLDDAAGPANGTYDFQFTVRDALTAGNTVGLDPLAATLAVSNGLFTATLDPGAGVFAGADRWLEIAVRTNGAGSFTTLSPRQQITAAPYALYAPSAGTAANADSVADPALSANVALLNRSVQSFTGGTNTFSGKVGIGTSNPANKLTVRSSANSYGIEHTDGTIRLGTFVGGSAGGGWLGTLSNHKLSFFTSGGSAAMTLDTTGKLGIGTNSPQARLHVVGDLLASAITGDGAGLTGLNAANLTGSVPSASLTSVPAASLTGTVADAALSINVALLNGTNVFTGTNSFANLMLATNANNQIAGAFTGNGAGLTNLNAAKLAGSVPSASLTSVPAASLTGTLADARLSTNVGLINGTNVFTGTNSFANVILATNANNQISGNGLGLTSLKATSLTGTLPDARLSANVGLLDGTNVFTDTNSFANVMLATNANNQISGNGLGLTSLKATSLTGTVPDARLSANVGLLNGTNVFTSTNRFANVMLATNANNQISGNGAGLTGLNATNLTGTLPDARLSANVALLNTPNVFTANQVIAGSLSGANILAAPLDNLNQGGLVQFLGAGTNAGWYIDNQAGYIRVNIVPYGQGGANVLNITRLGIGIGTSTPAYPLDVVGEIGCTAMNLSSDRNVKEQFQPVNARDVLDKVARLPISEWQYKAQADVRHIGPMAQDFRAAFALGRDDKHITSVDADGVALAAIQGLNEKLEELGRAKDTQIKMLEQSIETLQNLVQELARQQNGGAK